MLKQLKFLKKEKIVKKETTSKEKTIDISEETFEMPLEVAGIKVGCLLKEARLKKELKIADISKILCIRQSYLEAIENSNYETVPAYPYGEGFVKTYAKYLGLDAQKCVDLYKQESNPNKVVGTHFNAEQTEDKGMPGKRYLLISLVSILVVYAIWFTINKIAYEDIEDTETPIEETQEEQAEDFVFVVENFDTKTPEKEVQVVEQVVEETEQPDLTKTEVSSELQQEQPMQTIIDKNIARVVFVIKEETWIEVKKGDKLYVSKVFNAGETYSLPNEEGLIVSAGKVNSVDVLIDGVLTPMFKPFKKTGIQLDNFLKH